MFANRTILMQNALQRRPIKLGIRAVLLGSAALATAGAASAAIITVDSTADADPSNTSDGLCTLREAIEAAGTNAAVDTCAAGDMNPTTDLIEFADGLAGSTITVGTQLFTQGVTSTISGDVDGDGDGEITLSGGGTSRVLNIFLPPASLTLQHLTITDGYAYSLGPNYASGGAIANNGYLILNDVTVRNSYAEGSGGAIYNKYVASISNSTISGNSAGRFGGGIYNHTSADYLLIASTTVVDNSALADQGGGLANGGSARVVNSTFTNNEADNVGGAIYASDGALQVIHTTIAGNSATSGAGIFFASPIAATVWNNILINNTGGNCGGSGFFGASGNLNWPASDTSCGVLGVTDGDPMLGPLQDNGGPTLTMLPRGDGAAIDQVACYNGVGEDQRGKLRPSHLPGNQCDIGSVEYSPLDDIIFRDGFE